MLESSKASALTQTVDTLNLIARIGPCGAATIIGISGIPKGAVHLLFNELRRQRFPSLDHQGNFHLWTRLVGLPGHVLSKMDLRGLTQPRLTQLMDITGLLCHLGIIDGGSVYYILEVESSATISARSHERRSLSLYHSGISKCLLTWQPAVVQQSITEELVWKQAAPTATAHPRQLHGELVHIRRQDWSYDNGEDYTDIRCVAASVFNADSRLTAAVSMVGTHLQISEKYRGYLAGKAIVCTGDISRLLEWKSPFDLQTS